MDGYIYINNGRFAPFQILEMRGHSENQSVMLQGHTIHIGQPIGVHGSTVYQATSKDREAEVAKYVHTSEPESLQTALN